MEEEEEPATTKEDIASMVKEAIKEALPSILPIVQQEDELAKANLKISEMKNLIANKPQAPSSVGTNLDKAEVASDNKTFSPEQIAEIKAKYPNITVEDIVKNFEKK
jgi:hypothetical protein